ncbi:MAG: hypothetical protein ABIC36_02715 [bacterium]
MDKNRIMKSVVLGLTTLIATITWFWLNGAFNGSVKWIWPYIGFLILMIFLGLSWLLVKSRIVLLTTLIIILVCFFFSFGFRIEYLTIFFVALLLLLWGSHKALREKELGIKIRVSKILRQGLPSVLTGLCLIISMAYYFSPLAVIAENRIEIPRPLFDMIIYPITSGIETQTLLLQISEKTDNNDINDVLYQVINQEINKRSQSYQEYFSIGFAVGIFFALKVIGFAFMWIVILFSILIFKILVRIGAIKIQSQAILKEVIES